MHPLVLAFIAASLSLITPAPALAQAAPAPEFKILGDEEFPQGSTVFKSFADTLVGRFSNDFSMDAVLMRQNDVNSRAHAWNLWNPGKYEGTTHVDSGGNVKFTALAVLPGVIPSGGGTTNRDAILGSSTSGLEVLWYDYDSETYQSVLLVGTPFRFVEQLHVGNLGGGNAPDLVAYKTPPSGVSEIWVLEDVVAATAGPNVVFQHGLLRQIPFVDEVFDMTVLNYCGTARDEIAVVSDMGTPVMSATNGNVLHFYYHWQEGDRLEPVSNEGEPYERLLSVAQIQPGMYYTWLHSHTTSSDPMSMGPFDVVDIEAGDWDGDGLEDLAVSTQLNWNVYIFHQQVGTQAFVLSDTTTIDFENQFDPTDPSTQNHAAPVMYDLDRDGDCDLLTGLDFLEAAVFVQNQHVERLDQIPTMESQENGTAGLNECIGTYDYTYSLEQGEASFDLGQPHSWPRGFPTNSIETRVQIIVWRMANASLGADARPLTKQLFDWDPNASTLGTPWCPVRDFVIQPHNPTNDDRECMSLEIRIVWVDDTDRDLILDVGPSSFHVLTVYTDQRDILMAAGGYDYFCTNWFDTEYPPPEYGNLYLPEYTLIGCQGFGNNPPDNP